MATYQRGEESHNSAGHPMMSYRVFLKKKQSANAGLQYYFSVNKLHNQHVYLCLCHFLNNGGLRGKQLLA